jgi:hypothetical protein
MTTLFRTGQVCLFILGVYPGRNATPLEQVQRSHRFKRRLCGSVSQTWRVTVFLVQRFWVQWFSFPPPCRFDKPARCGGKRLEGETFRSLESFHLTPPVSSLLTAKYAPPTPRLRRTEKDAKRVSSESIFTKVTMDRQ